MLTLKAWIFLITVCPLIAIILLFIIDVICEFFEERSEREQDFFNALYYLDRWNKLGEVAVLCECAPITPIRWLRRTSKPHPVIQRQVIEYYKSCLYYD